MVPFEEIDRVKQISIPEYLNGLGFSPIKQVNKELLYLSPIRQERTPSFFVNLDKNIFRDFGVDEFKGDIIRLCQTLEQCSFKEAIYRLSSFQSTGANFSFSFSGQSSKNAQKESLEIIAIKPLQHAALTRYVESRGIPIAIARPYLQEIHYKQGERRYFAIGFGNDLGGYALRNGAGFKAQTSPAGITTIFKPGSSRICLFEGFFDFLSALVWYNKPLPTYTTIILNSTTNLSKCIAQLREKSTTTVYTFLDRDVAGLQAIERLNKHNLQVKDCSILYADYKDFNEFLLAKRPFR